MNTQEILQQGIDDALMHERDARQGVELAELALIGAGNWLTRRIAKRSLLKAEFRLNQAELLTDEYEDARAHISNTHLGVSEGQIEA